MDERIRLSRIRHAVHGRKLTIYTDGSCRPIRRDGSGPGAWAYSVSSCGKEICNREGQETETTSWAMEIIACIRALEALAHCTPESILICTDFADIPRIMNGQQQITGSADRIDLFEKLIEAAGSLSCPVSWKWVKGHSGKRFNELVDNRLRGIMGLSRKR